MLLRLSIDADASGQRAMYIHYLPLYWFCLRIQRAHDFIGFECGKLSSTDAGRRLSIDTGRRLSINAGREASASRCV
ncbi:hypothetical protein F2Q69_00054001 [Brassica cretica]|uniref:Uncharacterized protein n=1 Tax=Brassica cretica TaxID=69181 RepID=A0A8S9N1G1_BRACR|nr:hypothetical protein F2Q69_00054001 [Brassica cretica]